MNIVYKKTMKGVEEAALQSKGLALRLRIYLLLVDGAKSVDELIHTNPALPEIDMVLKALCDEGFLVAIAESPSTRVPISLQPFEPLPQINAQQTAPAPQARTQAVNSPQLGAAKNEMIAEVSLLLGKDANLVITKIQNAKTNDELFALLMGLKKIIGMYAGADKAEKFATKFTYIATL